MKRVHFLAAEVFGYSYYNYDGHLGERSGEGNLRFERYMPRDVRTLEQAAREDWSDERLAKALDVDIEQVAECRVAFQHAIDIVDAPSLAESFRHGVRVSILAALGGRTMGDAEIEALVTQICYRAADLNFRIEHDGANPSDFTNPSRFQDEASPGTDR